MYMLYFCSLPFVVVLPVLLAVVVEILKILLINTSAVSSINLGSILTYASCVNTPAARFSYGSFVRVDIYTYKQCGCCCAYFYCRYRCRLTASSTYIADAVRTATRNGSVFLGVQRSFSALIHDYFVHLLAVIDVVFTASVCL